MNNSLNPYRKPSVYNSIDKCTVLFPSSSSLSSQRENYHNAKRLKNWLLLVPCTYLVGMMTETGTLNSGFRLIF